MTPLPGYTIKVYSNKDQPPPEAEQLFKAQLAYSRKPLPEDRDDRDKWRFALTCAVTESGHVLGGVHLDIGPIGSGPLAEEKVAYLERTFVGLNIVGRDLQLSFCRKQSRLPEKQVVSTFVAAITGTTQQRPRYSGNVVLHLWILMAEKMKNRVTWPSSLYKDKREAQR